MAGVSGRSGGRNARTSQEHVLRGSFRKDRHGKSVSPDPPIGIPVPPKELQGDALDEWNRMVGRLTLSGTLSTVDDAVLYQYCKLFAETEAIAVTQAETATTIDLLEENLQGPKEEREDLLAVAQEITKLRQLESKYTTQVRQGRMAQRIFLVELGQTPASRSRIQVKKPEAPASKWAGALA